MMWLLITLRLNDHLNKWFNVFYFKITWNKRIYSQCRKSQPQKFRERGVWRRHGLKIRLAACYSYDDDDDDDDDDNNNNQ